MDEIRVEHVNVDDENIDIIYIATPHNLHHRFLIQSLKAGKHVFCEKAITVNDQQLEEAVAIAKDAAHLLQLLVG